MKQVCIFIVLTLYTQFVFAQTRYKCTRPNGRVVYQAEKCVKNYAEKVQKLNSSTIDLQKENKRLQEKNTRKAKEIKHKKEAYLMEQKAKGEAKANGFDAKKHQITPEQAKVLKSMGSREKVYEMLDSMGLGELRKQLEFAVDAQENRKEYLDEQIEAMTK